MWCFRSNQASHLTAPPLRRAEIVQPGVYPSSSRRFYGRGWVIASVLLAWASGCDPPAITPNGVIAVFGAVGLGPGDFSYPRAITATPDGKILVVDKAGRVQRFAGDGSYVSEWRMPETKQGKPVGLLAHRDGRVFIADTHYHRVMIYGSSDKLLTSFGGKGNGPGQFQLPTDVAIDADDFIYVSEYHGNDRITKWSPDLQFVQSLGEEPIEGYRLSRPAALVIDDEQTLWVADACNHRLVRFALDGTVLATVGGFGREPGQLRYPYDVDVSPKGDLLVCEYGGDRLQWFSKDGESLRVWGNSGRKPGELSGPWGAAYGPDGLVYVVDSLNSRIQIVRP